MNSYGTHMLEDERKIPFLGVRNNNTATRNLYKKN